MTHEAEGMEVSQLVASSSATVHGVFVGAVSPVKSSRKNSAMKYSNIYGNSGKLRHIISATLMIQRTYMAIWENFVKFFPRH